MLTKQNAEMGGLCKEGCSKGRGRQMEGEGCRYSEVKRVNGAVQQYMNFPYLFTKREQRGRTEHPRTVSHANIIIHGIYIQFPVGFLVYIC